MLDDDIKSFLSVVRLGLGHDAPALPETIHWDSVYKLCSAHSVSAVALDGLQVLSDNGELSGNHAIDPALKKRWIGAVLRHYESERPRYEAAISSLAAFYNEHGFKMMLLKGYGLSLNYPVPEHRPCGDIDIWLFGRQKEADALMSEALSKRIDNSHHHHSVFSWKGYTVENHYDWVNVHAHRSSAEIEKIFKSLAMDDSHCIDIAGQKVYLPSPNLHALFLVRHALSHFAAVGISLRQVIDWGLYVEKHSSEIDWNWLVSAVEQFKMTEFFHCLNSICINDLGFDEDLFPPIKATPSIKERVLADIITPEFSEKPPKGVGRARRVAFKYRRWRANSWKNAICYGDNLFLSFLVSSWSHLLKPSSI